MCTSYGWNWKRMLCGVCGARARMLVCVCVCVCVWERERERERNRRVNFILMIILCCGAKTFHRFPLQLVAWFRQNYFGGWEILMRYFFSCQNIWPVSVSATLFFVLKHLAGLSVSATRAGPYQPVYSEPAYALHGEASREHVQGLRYRHLHQDSTETRRLQSLRGFCADGVQRQMWTDHQHIQQ